MFLFNLGLGILLLVLLIILLQQPVCPRCGRLWPARVHTQKVWADDLQPVPKLYRSASLDGQRYSVEYVQFVIYQVTYRCQHDDCMFTWNQFERLTEIVEKVGNDSV